jgi:hypothetical protein
MTDEKKSASDALNEWGIDVDKFKERARESIEAARGDLSEVTGTLRQALVQARDVVSGINGAGSPAAAELKAGFERAWHEIESAFRAAREKASQGKPESGAASDPEPPKSDGSGEA